MRCILSNQFSLKGCAKAQQAEKVNQVQCADLVCCLWYNRDLMCFVLDWLNVFFTVWKNRFWIESSYASTEFSRQLFLLVGVGGYLCHLFLWNLEELFSRVCSQDYEVNYSDFCKLPADIFWQSWSAVKLCILIMRIWYGPKINSQLCIQARCPIRPVLTLRICSMKQLGIFLLPPGGNALHLLVPT